MKNLFRYAGILLISVQILAACQNQQNTKTDTETLLLSALVLQPQQQDTSISIKGSWTDNWNTDHTIENAVWESKSSYGTSVYTIHYYSNNESYLIYQNPEDASYNPSKYGRRVWHKINENKFAYCEDIYGKDTYNKVFNSTAVKPVYVSETETNCGGFTWTIAERKT